MVGTEQSKSGLMVTTSKNYPLQHKSKILHENRYFLSAQLSAQWTITFKQSTYQSQQFSHSDVCQVVGFPA